MYQRRQDTLVEHIARDAPANEEFLYQRIGHRKGSDNSMNQNASSIFALLGPRGLRLGLSAGLLVLSSGVGGCQNRPEVLSKSAQIFLDSLAAANEALFDSATANLAYERLSCLEQRALLTFDFREVERLSTKGYEIERARHSRAERVAGERGIAVAHDAPTPEFCRPVDSLWYATVAKQRRRAP